MEITLEQFVNHFNSFADNTHTARGLSERDRDYVDHRQLTASERDALQKRGQPPVIINRIQPKVNFMLGTERQTRTDPKAYPRTPKHEDSAAAITDALRYVADNAVLDQIASDAFENQIVEGTGGAIVEVDPDTTDININHIEWDRLYWDVHSRRLDFSDSTRFGIVLWMDLDAAVQRWPGKKDSLENQMADSTPYDTFEDKPNFMRWTDRDRKRVMIMQEYYHFSGKWYEAFFCYSCFLEEAKVSPYLDEDGVPTCPIELQSSFADREGNRYGPVRGYIDIQDEINKRRSKALHIAASTQTMGEKGAVSNINKMKTEKARPDGHIEYNPGMEFQFVDQSADLLAQLNFLQEAKAEIDAVGANAAMSGDEGRNMSGRALQSRQQGGHLELGPIYDRHRMWKRRIYRQIWARIRQFWTAEKWIRVTDDENNLKFIGLNEPVTYRQQMEEHAQKTGEQIPPELLADPRIDQVAEVRNPVPELDMDIILDESPDVITLQHEAFEHVMDAMKVSGQPLPMETIIELMPSVPNKRQMLDKLKGDEEQAAAMAQKKQQAEQLQEAMAMAELGKIHAETEKTKADTAGAMASAQEAGADSEQAEANAVADIMLKRANARKAMADAEAQELETDLVESGLKEFIGG